MRNGSELPQELYDVIRGSIRVAVAAKVVTFDPATSSATIIPEIGEERRLDDGTVELLTPVEIAGVPVLFPGPLRFGLSAGAYGLALIRHRSHDEWDNGTAGPVAPSSTRRFDFSDVVFLPTLHQPGGTAVESSRYKSNGEPVIRVEAGQALRLGASTATDGLARGSLTDAHFDTIAANFATIAGLLNGLLGPGSYTPTFIAPSSVASTRVFSDG